MKTFIFATAATLMFGVCAPAFAGTDTSGAPQTVAAQPATGVAVSGASTTKGPDDPNQVICKTVEVTGSHLGSKRTCRTRAVWDEMTRASREATENFQNSDTGTNIPH